MPEEYNLSPGRSTGPTSEEGKLISSRNAAVHGMSCSTFFLLPNEKEEEFEALKQKWTAEYKAFDSPALAGYLDKLVQADWLFQRGYRCVFESESALAMAEMNRDHEMVDQVFKRLQRMQRYKTNYEASYYRALRAIEAYRRSRLAERLVEARLKKMAATKIVSRAEAPPSKPNRLPPQPHENNVAMSLPIRS